jgi:hypothetical protein
MDAPHTSLSRELRQIIIVIIIIVIIVNVIIIVTIIIIVATAIIIIIIICIIIIIIIIDIAIVKTHINSFQVQRTIKIGRAAGFVEA